MIDGNSIPILSTPTLPQMSRPCICGNLMRQVFQLLTMLSNCLPLSLSLSDNVYVIKLPPSVFHNAPST